MASAAAALLALAAILSHAQPDPPAQAGRLSYITGNVSFQPVGSDDFGQAFPNLPLGPGDRIVTDYDGQAEIQVGQTFVRIGPNADVSLVDSTPDGLYFGVAQGSIHVQVFGLWDGQSVYVNTPSGSVTESTPGQFRVDVFPDQEAAVFTGFGNQNHLLVTGAGGFSQDVVRSALELVGSNPVVPQWLQPADWDVLDQWSGARDKQIAQAAAYQYVSREIPGAYELDASGSWQPETPYGPAWFPNNVQAGWAPYHNGHWVNHAPWGWVWVEDESWGYAPFHYGRWVSWNGRWGWVPGPPAAHPVWSPALVVFAGGIHVGGVTVSAWFPLGPGEPYRPWYPCSPHYLDVVNRTNIVEAPRVHVQTTYVNINVVNITYVNRTTVTAMNHEDFAAGRPARQASVVVDVHLMEHVQPLAAPEPRPTPQSFIGHPPARPVTVNVARPVLINEKGLAVAAKPGAPPMQPPVKAAPPVVRPLPGHVAVAPPPNARPAPAARVAPAAAPKPEPKPIEEPAAKTPPIAAKPEAKPMEEPAAKTPPAEAEKAPAGEAAKPSAKPGTNPPAKTNKNKKDDKDKGKDEKKPE
ncbi:MAG: DUF6600 domain-containing protein [Terracidiphilus sp.]